MASCPRNPDSDASVPLGWFMTALGCHLMREGMGHGMLWCNSDVRGDMGVIEDERGNATARVTTGRALPDGRRLIARCSGGGSA